MLINPIVPETREQAFKIAREYFLDPKNQFIQDIDEIDLATDYTLIEQVIGKCVYIIAIENCDDHMPYAAMNTVAFGYYPVDSPAELMLTYTPHCLSEY